MTTLEFNGTILKIQFDECELEKSRKYTTLLRLVLGFELQQDKKTLLRRVLSKNELNRLLMDLSEEFSKQHDELTFDQRTKTALESLRTSYELRARIISDKHEATKWEISKPTFFSRTLLPYQVKPVEQAISNFNTANFSVPGSGKTTMTYAAFSVMQHNRVVDKMLVVCPTSAFQPWEEEYEECFKVKPNQKVRRISGNQHYRKALYSSNSRGHDVFLISYDTLRNDVNHVSDMMNRHRFLMVLDESHRVKNPSGKTFECCIGLAPLAERRIILTGTPVTNTLLDLWAQITFIWPDTGILGPLEAYERKITRGKGLEWTKDKLNPFYYRIKKGELKLPKQFVAKIKVPMSERQMEIYLSIAKKTLDQIDSGSRNLTMEWKRAALIRLMQTASNPSLLKEHSDEFRLDATDVDPDLVTLSNNYSRYEMPPKIKKATELARNIVASGRKVVIWSNFVLNVKTIKKTLSDLGSVEIFGGIPLQEKDSELKSREKHLREFKNNKNVRVLVANPAACAESISLHKVCHDAIYVDRTYNAGHLIQSMDRIHRIGLEPNTITQYYMLICKNSIDERIDKRLNEKINLLQQLMDDPFKPVSIDFEVDDEGKLVESFDTSGDTEGDFNDAIRFLRKSV